MRFVHTRDQVRIYYRLIGSGSKTILFVHPPGMGHITFKQQLPLSKDYRLLFVDLRGNGNSGKGELPITFSLLARDMYDVCQQLAINKVVMCGYSNGASIAMETALHYPDMIEGLILIGAFSEVNSFQLHSEFLLGMAATNFNEMELVAHSVAHAHTYSKRFAEEMKSYFMRTSPSVLNQFYKEGLAYNCTEQLGEIKSPILLIYGQKDYYVHHYQKEFLKRHTNTQVIYITGARHQIPTKHPNELNAITKRFLADLQK